MSANLMSIGLATPSNSMSQEDAARVAVDLSTLRSGTRDRLRSMYANSGVARRGVAFGGDSPAEDLERLFGNSSPGTAERSRLYQEAALPLATQASRRAIEDAEINPCAITHLIAVSCTGFHAPGVDIALMETLGLNTSVSRLMVGFMGCHGVMNALRVADSIVSGDPNAVVLICAVEICSVHYQRHGKLDQQIANALFADGAAATVVCHETMSDRAVVGLESYASEVIPDTQHCMSWRIGDHGFEMTLSPRVPDLIEKHLPAFNDRLYAGANEDLGWIIHPGGPRVLDAVQSTLRLSEQALAPSRSILRDHGNMSSTTVLFILDKLIRDGCEGSCVALAFGPGLTIEGACLALAPARLRSRVDDAAAADVHR